jgi:hypothetical protein
VTGLVVPFQADGLLTAAPSEIVHFDNRQADVMPIEDIFYRWKVGMQEKAFLVRYSPALY